MEDGGRKIAALSMPENFNWHQIGRWQVHYYNFFYVSGTELVKSHHT